MLNRLRRSLGRQEHRTKRDPKSDHISMPSNMVL
jgi:hypothetical protein